MFCSQQIGFKDFFGCGIYIYIHIMCIEIKTMASQKKRWDLQIYKVGATRSDKYIAHWKDCATLKSWA